MSVAPNFDFAQVMLENYPAYKWEPLKVLASPDPNYFSSTDPDKYELTTYKIWSEDKRDPAKGWVFFQHGSYMSGSMWLHESSKIENGTSQFIAFAEMGYDVYLGTNRGGFVS